MISLKKKIKDFHTVSQHDLFKTGNKNFLQQRESKCQILLRWHGEKTEKWEQELLFSILLQVYSLFICEDDFFGGDMSKCVFWGMWI